MIRHLLNLIAAPFNVSRMDAWTARVDRIVGNPPGCDDDFSDDSIAAFSGVDFRAMSTWTIVCEEVLDTTHPTIYHQRAREALNRRGITDTEYEEMRRFAWLTAGWLNFEKMLWDWVHLDENDILRALRLQFTEGLISKKAYDRSVAYTQRYTNVCEPCE